jgi:glycerate 2-kinase
VIPDRHVSELERPAAVRLLEDLFRAALAAADPMRSLATHLPEPPAGRTVVVGLGKAAAAMARAVEAVWPGPLGGVVAVPRGATLPLMLIEQVEASHPVPDERSVVAARRLMDALRGLQPDDLVLALVSGGGSPLCALPAEGVGLAEKQAITRALLARGATIHEINTVHTHLSAFKGGRLAVRAFPSPVVSLLLSDIPGDDPDLIASAPTLADPSSCAEALHVLERYAVELSQPLRDALAGGRLESPKPGDPLLAGHRHHIVAGAQDGLDAAARAAQARGWSVHVLSDAMRGEARELAKAHAAIALQVQRRRQAFAPPCVILSGGEATVAPKGRRRGGRNTEFALALALALEGRSGIHALSAGADGLDGRAAAAGAWVGPDTLAAGRARGLDPLSHLLENDSFGFLEGVGAALVTGPAHTHITDFRAVLVESVAQP